MRSLGSLLGRGLNKSPEMMPAEVGYSGKALSNPTLRENLEMTKVELERRLAEVNDAIKALDENPAVLTILEKLSKLGY